MRLTIISPEKIIFDGDTDGVFVPGSKGTFEILKGHAPIISSLQKGIMRYKHVGEQIVSIKGGFVEVSNDNIVACVEI